MSRAPLAAPESCVILPQISAAYLGPSLRAVVTARETAATMRVRRIPQTFALHNDARRTLTLLNSSLQQVRRLGCWRNDVSATRVELSASVRLEAESQQRRFLQALIPQGTEPPQGHAQLLKRVSACEGGAS